MKDKDQNQQIGGKKRLGKRNRVEGLIELESGEALLGWEINEITVSVKKEIVTKKKQKKSREFRELKCSRKIRYDKRKGKFKSFGKQNWANRQRLKVQRNRNFKRREFQNWPRKSDY